MCLLDAIAFEVEPQNSALLARHAAVQRMREAKLATVPTILKHETLGRNLNDKLNLNHRQGCITFLFLLCGTLGLSVQTLVVANLILLKSSTQTIT